MNENRHWAGRRLLHVLNFCDAKNKEELEKLRRKERNETFSGIVRNVRKGDFDRAKDYFDDALFYETDYVLEESLIAPELGDVKFYVNKEKRTVTIKGLLGTVTVKCDEHDEFNEYAGKAICFMQYVLKQKDYSKSKVAKLLEENTIYSEAKNKKEKTLAVAPVSKKAEVKKGKKKIEDAEKVASSK